MIRNVLLAVLASLTTAFLPPACNLRSKLSVIPQQASLLLDEEDALSTRIKDGLSIRYAPEDIRRVIGAWDRMVQNRPFEDRGAQRFASSYVEGLQAKPWHDVSEFAWLQKLEQNVKIVQDELQSALQMGETLDRTGNNVWIGAVTAEGAAYGPGWKTLVLQDRQWDDTNTRIFPQTTQLLRDLDAPTVEVFFARQTAKSGIQLHSDGCNFILTTHLGLDVPEGQCWIKVGGEKREWKNGKAIVFDTHYNHETGNESDKDRFVLLIRFWHPGVTATERQALQYIFDSLDGPDAQTNMDYDYLNKIAEAQLASRRPPEEE